MSMQQDKLSKNQLDAIYNYLTISYDDMSEDEQKMWVLLLSIHDPEFEDTGEEEN